MPSARRVNWARFRVSMVCLVALLILLTLFYLLTAGELLLPKATVYMYVPDATGLIAGAPVRVNGIGVGKVGVVRLTGSPVRARAIQVGITIAREHLANIPMDSYAELSTDNLIGDKFVDISSGTDPRHVPPNGEIRFKEQTDFMKTMDVLQFEKQLRIVDAMLTQIEQGQGRVGQFVQTDDVYKGLLQKLHEFQNDIKDISDANTSLGQTLYSSEMYRQIREPVVELDRSLAQIQSGQGSTGQLFRDSAQYEQLRATARDLLRSVRDLRADEFMKSDSQYESWNRMVSSLIRSVDEMNANPMLNRRDTYENLQGLSREMSATVKDFREHPSKYLRLKVF